MDLTAVQVAAVGAAILVTGVAMFQAALALGLALGGATFGGRAPHVDGVLTAGFRAVAGASAIVLLAIAWLVLARAGVVARGPVEDGVVVGATWVVLVFLVLNTVGNFSAPHPVERWVMGPVTLAVAALVAVVATRA